MASRIHHRDRGFTIIETLVALSIFTFAVLGLIVITSQGIADTNFAKNKLVASYLAQEGIELVRNMRDSSMLGGATWQDTFNGSSSLTGLSNCYLTSTTSGCDIDAYSLAIDTCSAASRSAGCGPLHFDTSTGAYHTESQGIAYPATVWNRIITLRDMSPNEVEVTATVSWVQGTAPRSVTVSETLFNWVTITPTAPSPNPTPTSFSNPTPSPSSTTR